MKISTTIFFLIVDQPEIEQEETFIHTQEGDETEVICVVHASPKAEIKWFKVRINLEFQNGKTLF